MEKHQQRQRERILQRNQQNSLILFNTTPKQLNKRRLFPGRSLWDWLQFLIVPVMLAVLGVGFTIPQNATSLHLNRKPQETALQMTQDQPPLTEVDWANFTYVSSCYGSVHSFTTKDGQATTGFIHLEVYPPVFGNLTGDGRQVAVIRYTCSAADFGGTRAFVYGGNKTHPILLGDLPFPMQHIRHDDWIVEQVRISNGTIQLKGKTYSPVAARCCPDLQFKASYRWDGVHLVTTHFATIPLLSN